MKAQLSNKIAERYSIAHLNDLYLGDIRSLSHVDEMCAGFH